MKCPMCNNNLGRGKYIGFSDLARMDIRIYNCPICKSKVVINPDTKELIRHMCNFKTPNYVVKSCD